MKHFRILALSVAAILMAGTVSAEAFERYNYGEFGDGLAENDFFGQPMGNGLPRMGGSVAASALGYGYPDSYPFYGPIFGSNTYAAPGYDYRQQELFTGRSAAMGGFGKYCSTPIKTCLLYEPAILSIGCSCKVQGGHSYGNVTP